MKRKIRFICLLGALSGITIFMACDKSETGDPSPGQLFPVVKSIIATNCLSCHSTAGYWTGRPIAFDTDSSIAAQYVVIKSAVADPVTPYNKRMPEGGMLSAHDIDVIVKWFDKGGKVTD